MGLSVLLRLLLLLLLQKGGLRCPAFDVLCELGLVLNDDDCALTVCTDVAALFLLSGGVHPDGQDPGEHRPEEADEPLCGVEPQYVDSLSTGDVQCNEALGEVQTQVVLLLEG